jgi:hypothetical protein
MVSMTRAFEFLSTFNEGEVPMEADEKAIEELIDQLKTFSDNYDLLCYLDLEDYDKDSDLWDNPDFLSKIRYFAERSVGQASFDIGKHIQGDSIMIYREITAPPDWTPDDPTVPLGIYWSWNKNAAEAHWGKFSAGHVKFLMTGKVNIADVDWAHTLAVNAHPSSSEECEIYVPNDSDVELLDWRQVK